MKPEIRVVDPTSPYSGKVFPVEMVYRGNPIKKGKDDVYFVTSRTRPLRFAASQVEEIHGGE